MKGHIAFFFRFPFLRFSQLLAFLHVWNPIQAQEADTILKREIYTSYFSYSLRQPLYVIYELYNGGGDCDRNEQGFRFTDCGLEQSAKPSDYRKSGFDMGHLANAEDFAFDCRLEAQTFCMENCLPQHPSLNRGIWKTWEQRTRDFSKSDTVVVVCGGIFGNQTIGHNHAGVPDFCFKLVYRKKNKELIFARIFPNMKEGGSSEISISDLRKRLPFHLDIGTFFE